MADYYTHFPCLLDVGTFQYAGLDGGNRDA